MNTAASNRDGLPESFLAQFGEHVIGFLSGFDRLRFRATLRPLFRPRGLERYLYCCQVLIKDFSGFAQKLTDRIKERAYELFRQAGRPIQYLTNSDISKEALAQQLAKNDAISQGAVALFACVESCLSFNVRGDRQAKQLRLVLEHSKCTHLYHYYHHPEFGLMHVRVQTWFRFTVDICLNARHWLAHQMDQALSTPNSSGSIVQKKAMPRAQRAGATYVVEWLICIAGPKSLRLPITGTSSL